VVDVVFGELGAAAHRVEVGAAEVSTVGVAQHIGERVPLAELALVPDEVDEVELGRHGLLRPPPAAGAPDQVEAGVDPAYVIVEVLAAEHAGHDVLVDQSPRRLEHVGDGQLLDVLSHRSGILT